MRMEFGAFKKESSVYILQGTGEVEVRDVLQRPLGGLARLLAWRGAVDRAPGRPLAEARTCPGGPGPFGSWPAAESVAMPWESAHTSMAMNRTSTLVKPSGKVSDERFDKEIEGVALWAPLACPQRRDSSLPCSAGEHGGIEARLLLGESQIDLAHAGEPLERRSLALQGARPASRQVA